MTTSAAFSIVSPYNVRNVQRQACVRTGWTCPITPNSASGTLARLPNARISLLKQELERLLLEFVSANPTGPLHVGHGRQAAYGATLANILTAVGFEVAREYYINDAGRQMDILAVSTWLRYLGLCGEELPFPQNGYRGDYVLPLAHKLKALVREQLRRPAASVLAQLPQDAPAGDKEAYIDALIARARELLGAEGFGRVLELSLSEMLADIPNDLGEFGVGFDHWSSERALP